MLALAQTAEYADVFLDTSRFNVLAGVFGLLAVIGICAAVIAVASFDRERKALFYGGLGALFVGIAGVGGSLILQAQTESQIIENMKMNVESKYHAELKLDQKDKAKDLSEPVYYTLVFENDSSAKYQMYFNKDSEPILVDRSKAPSVEELNSR